MRKNIHIVRFYARITIVSRMAALVGCVVLFAGAVYFPIRLLWSSSKKFIPLEDDQINLPKVQTTRSPFSEDVAQTLEKHCSECHAGRDAEGGFSLSDYRDEQAIQQHWQIWERAAHLVSTNAMPPANAPQLPVSDKGKLLDSLEEILSRTKRNEVTAPVRVVMRRLNRFEYNNTIRDLLGINFQPADDFPSDDVDHGFDNISDILSFSPLLMEKYLVAAEKIAEAVITTDVPETTQLAEQQMRVFQPLSVGQQPIASVRENLAAFLPKAFRRPVDAEELNAFVSLANAPIENGESVEFAMQTALTAVLVSPHFLFRTESDPNLLSVTELSPLREYELATRLSYFLWSSMPDDELLQRAKAGDLHTDAVLEAQLRRMLKDQKSLSLTESFAVQWLNLGRLEAISPDSTKFAEFDTAIKQDFERETKAFFQYVVQDDRSILEFLDGPYTFVNDRLAEYYGLPDVEGPHFRKISLEGSPRAGLLTQGSILTLTSTPLRTSPVKRGKWILEAILNQPPPPAPPNVPDLAESAQHSSDLTLRQQLELHRANPACAACHVTMDALGFALENFDAIGRWRDTDGELPIDTTSRLPDGTSFRGSLELIALLKQRESDFARCLTNKLLIYALGRRLEFSDRAAVNSIVKSLKAHDFKFSVLVCEIVKSRPFRKWPQ